MVFNCYCYFWSGVHGNNKLTRSDKSRNVKNETCTVFDHSGGAYSAVGGSPCEPSPLVERLKLFLPELKKANAVLMERVAADGAEAVDIEAVDADSPHIQMVWEHTAYCRDSSLAR